MRLVTVKSDLPRVIDLLRLLVVNVPLGQGINVAEVERRLRVKRALDKADENGIRLEDTDHAHLLAIYESFSGFTNAVDEIVEIRDAIKNAATVDA
jgi:hypothetical protein